MLQLKLKVVRASRYMWEFSCNGFICNNQRIERKDSLLDISGLKDPQFDATDTNYFGARTGLQNVKGVIRLYTSLLKLSYYLLYT